MFESQWQARKALHEATVRMFVILEPRPSFLAIAQTAGHLGCCEKQHDKRRRATRDRRKEAWVNFVPHDQIHEIEHLIARQRFELADQAVKRAIAENDTADFKCLWVFYHGATVAQACGKPHVALAHLSRFVVDAERLGSLGQHERRAVLELRRFRCPTLDVVQDARGLLPQLERDAFELLSMVPELAGDESAIKREVEKCRATFLRRGGCFSVIVVATALAVAGAIARVVPGVLLVLSLSVDLGNHLGR